MDLLNLPIVMIENILSYLTYDEIAKSRIVCKAFNDICMRMLNRGFMMIERKHEMALKNVKAQLPRRESERRYHPLFRHCDILSSIETRISMLNMTYSKFMDGGMCCFIPGKVIDEIKRVLLLVENSETPPRAHEVLQELRDISSMAIEHFDDKISPALRKRMLDNAVSSSHSIQRTDIGRQWLRNRGRLLDSPFPVAQPVVGTPDIGLRQDIFLLRRRAMINARLIMFLTTQYRKLHKNMISYRSKSLKQRKCIKRLLRKQNDTENAVADLKKRIDECDIKYAELTHTNQAVGGKVASASTSEVSPNSAQPLRNFASQIKLDLSVMPIGTSKRSQALLPNMKPRKPVIKIPSLTERSNSPQPSTSKNENSKSTNEKPAEISTNEKKVLAIKRCSENTDGASDDKKIKTD